MKRTMTASAAAVTAGVMAGLLQVLVSPVASPGVTPVSESGSCVREIEEVSWFFDPCEAEGEPLPPDVITALEEDRRARECAAAPSPSAAAARRAAPRMLPTHLETAPPTEEPTETAEPTQTPTALPTEPTADPTASPCPEPTTPEPTPTGPEPTPTEPEAAPTVPEPTPTVPQPTPTTPGPTPTGPQPTPTTTDPGTCALPSAQQEAGREVTDLAARVREAAKDKLCPPNRNPQSPVVVVATGDSVTSAHIQLTHYHVPKKCSVNGNTQADHRRLHGNDMTASYVGKYVGNLNTSVVDYYNFARTGMGTPHLLGPEPGWKDACENPWGRAFTPIELAEAAITKAKQDGRQAYYVSTGGINNTNWTEVAKGAAFCGMAEFLRIEAVRFFIRNNLPFNAVMRYYDTTGKVINRDAVIKGGACQVVLQEQIGGGNPRDITIERLRFDIPVYDGPTHYPTITRDVGIITARALNAGADKLVWMGYYDITPAKVSIGTFAKQWVQNTELPATVKGALPDIPNAELDLVTGQAWKTQVQTWTNELNNAIKASILPADPMIRFVRPPALGADKIQKTMIGGCPHPNLAGHDDLARSLDAAFRALG